MAKKNFSPAVYVLRASGFRIRFWSPHTALLFNDCEDVYKNKFIFPVFFCLSQIITDPDPGRLKNIRILWIRVRNTAFSYSNNLNSRPASMTQIVIKMFEFSQEGVTGGLLLVKKTPIFLKKTELGNAICRLLLVKHNSLLKRKP